MPKILWEAQALGFAYPQQLTPLFQSLDFSIHTQDRIGLIGENGSGKSTLLQLLQGQHTPQAGRLHRHPTLRPGHWRQTPPTEALSVAEFLWQARPELARLQAQLQQAERLTPETLFDVLNRFEALGGYTYEDMAQREWSQWGGNIQDWDRPLQSLSGGEQARVLWCHLRLQDANFYLIDEPGNHLDSAGLELLERFLQTSPHPYLLVSHDRYLLDHCCSQIWHLAQGQLTQRQGNLSHYQAEQEAARQRLARQSAQQEKAVQRLQQAAQKQRSQAERFENFKPQRSVKKNGGICQRDEGGGKASLNVGGLMRKAKATEARMERLTAAIERPQHARSRTLHFHDGITRHRQLLAVQNLTLAYQRPLFVPLNWRVQAGEKWHLQGSNGSGKSSLLHALWQAQSEPSPLQNQRAYALSGAVHWAQGINVAYLPQNPADFAERETPLAWVMQQADAQRPETDKRTEAQTLLACLQIQGSLLHSPLTRLSPGERQRVVLAGLLIQQPDILLLDEPTNHLSLSAREALLDALQQYPGALILVSHDRFFSEQLTQSVERLTHAR